MKLLDHRLLDELARKADDVPRLRAHHNLHDDLADPVQRLCIVFQPDTYVRPHRHREANKDELTVILVGHIALLTFDDEGRVVWRAELKADGDVRGVEVPHGTLHSLVSLAADSTILEVKGGPYLPTPETDFAPWAPPEGDPRASRMVRWMETAEVGDRAPFSG